MFVQAWGKARSEAGKPMPDHESLVRCIGEALADIIAVYPEAAGSAIATMFEGMQRGFEGTPITFIPHGVNATGTGDAGTKH
jgi:hypothetical protein